MFSAESYSPVPNQPSRYARAVTASKKVRWDIDVDVIRGRGFDVRQKFLPDGLSFAHELAFLTDAERRFFSQIQGRTYANIFGLVERFVNAKVLEVSKRHYFGDQVALEALVRFSDEELKHQELFRRVEALAARDLPPGYHFVLEPNEVASAVLAKSTWAVLALTCLIELFTQAHYRESIEPDPELSELFRDVFKFHWMEESQHAVLDELEWAAEDATLGTEERETGVGDLIDLVGAVDALLALQRDADADYFFERVGRELTSAEQARVRATLLAAYRYQYIFSGLERTRFPEILGSLISERQFERVVAALVPLKNAA
jgi:hypothetical protein